MGFVCCEWNYRGKGESKHLDMRIKNSALLFFFSDHSFYCVEFGHWLPLNWLVSHLIRESRIYPRRLLIHRKCGCTMCSCSAHKAEAWILGKYMRNSRVNKENDTMSYIDDLHKKLSSIMRSFSYLILLLTGCFLIKMTCLFILKHKWDNVFASTFCLVLLMWDVLHCAKYSIYSKLHFYLPSLVVELMGLPHR